jgi:acetyltransferase
VATSVAESADAAVEQASRMGFPVVLKLYSKTITHKSDVDGVKLNLIDESAVRGAFDAIRRAVTDRKGAEHFQGVTVQQMVRLKDAYELIIGASVDPQFGPVLLFGSGGQLVEVMKDRALALPPLNGTLARRLMEQTKIYKALHGVRGRPPCDLKRLELLLVNFSRLVVEQPLIKEIDINPLVINHERMIALDARVVVHDASVLEFPRPAIRPYPSQYIEHWTAKDGTPLTIRPIRPEDEPLLARMHEQLSEETVRRRYFSAISFGRRVEHERLSRVCFNDYDRELALVAEHHDRQKGVHEIVAVGRLSKMPHEDAGEYAVLVADAWQNKGLGTKLLSSIINVAKAEKLRRLYAIMLPGNTSMQRVSEKLGFRISQKANDEDVHAEMRFDN